MPESFMQGYAVVVGAGGDLPVTARDAQGVAKVLRDPGRCGYPPGQVRCLTEAGAQRGLVLGALDWLAGAAGPEATAVVYFSGHGVETPGHYLLPHGYQEADLAGTAIAGAEFTDRLRAIRARKLIVLLDCCFAGGQAEAKGPAWAKAPLPPGVVAALGASSGRVVIASSRRDEVSWTGMPYSVFTRALLEGLAGAGAFEHDGYARVLDLALYLGRTVPNRTGDKQHPIIKVAGLEDNFALAYYAGGAKQPQKLEWAEAEGETVTAAVPAPGPAAADVASWRRILANRREALLLMEERMSEYVEYTEVPLTLIRNRRRTEAEVAELERRLNVGT